MKSSVSVMRSASSLIASRLRAVLHEAQRPVMDALEIGVAAGGEGAQQVQRRRRLPVGLELAARIGHARLGRELDVVDDVAAVARQLDAVAASRSATSAAWRTGRRCGRPSPPAMPPAYVSTTAICRKTRKKSRILSARVLGEALGAVAALKQKRLPAAMPRAASSACAPRRQKPAAGNVASCFRLAKPWRPDSPAPA